MKINQEIRRMQTLAGISEIKIKKPLSISIKPTHSNGGFIYIDDAPIEYNINQGKAHIDICNSYDFLLSINSPLLDMGDEDGNVDAEMINESKKLCETYLSMMRGFFGDAVTIEEDDYRISYYSMPEEAFNKRISSNEKVKQINNNTFEYKNRILKTKQLSPAELEDYINQYMVDYYRLFPHMETNKRGEKQHIIDIYFSDKSYYYIIDDKENYYTDQSPRSVLANEPKPIAYSRIFKNNNLDLISIFNYIYEPTDR
jgi:hypothetical protein